MKQALHFIFSIILCCAAISFDTLNAQSTANFPAAIKNSPASDYLLGLLRFEPWAESIWKDYPAIPGSGYFGDGESRGNGGIRGNAGISVCYATLIRALPNDPKRKHRLERLSAALRYAVETHASGPPGVVAADGNKWAVFPGMEKYNAHDWQSPMWASFMGFAAALAEKELDPELVRGCKRVIAAEADILSTIPPANGYRLDTKTEENAWDSPISALAAAWMPQDSRAPKWIATAKKYMANTYSVPADLSGPLKEWITTQTLFPSYALENHGFYHPAYQKDGGQSLGDAYLMMRMINPSLEKELRPFTEHNVIHVWDFLKGILMDNGELAYPSGLDWTLNQFEHASYVAWMAMHFKRPEAQWVQPRVAKQILYRQKVNGDGRFVGESCPNGFYAEALQSLGVAMSYLHNEVEGFPVPKGAPFKDFIVHYPDVGLVVQRSRNSIATVSYGARTMALVYPLNGGMPSRQFFISPNQGSLIGTRGKTQLLNYTQTTKGFRIELKIADKNGRSGEVIIEHQPGAMAVIDIPSDTAKYYPSKWTLGAFENHALSGGQRTLFSGDQSKVIKERSADSVAAFLAHWINIDNWMGIVAASDGHFGYQGASRYNRNGAAEDTVFFKPQNNKISKAVILLPGSSAKATQQVQHSVSWKKEGNADVLSFTGPDHKKISVSSSK